MRNQKASFFRVMNTTPNAMAHTATRAIIKSSTVNNFFMLHLNTDWDGDKKSPVHFHHFSCALLLEYFIFI